MIGPAAAQARGVDLSGLPVPTAVAIFPAEDPANLALLADTLTTATHPRLRVGGQPAGLPLTLTAAVLTAIPLLPLTTPLGDLDVVLAPPGAGLTYREAAHDARYTTIDGVSVLTPSLPGLAAGLAADLHVPSQDLLDRISHAADAMAIVTMLPTQDPHHVLTDREVQRVVLDAVRHLDRPASIRELTHALASRRRLTYKDVQAAAVALCNRGKLLRDKCGTAYYYRINTDHDDQVARETAELLATVANPAEIIAKVHALLDQRAAGTAAGAAQPIAKVTELPRGH